jgi:hypothetical protein
VSINIDKKSKNYGSENYRGKYDLKYIAVKIEIDTTINDDQLYIFKFCNFILFPLREFYLFIAFLYSFFPS